MWVSQPWCYEYGRVVPTTCLSCGSTDQERYPLHQHLRQHSRAGPEMQVWENWPWSQESRRTGSAPCSSLWGVNQSQQWKSPPWWWRQRRAGRLTILDRPRVAESPWHREARVCPGRVPARAWHRWCSRDQGLELDQWFSWMNACM